MEKFKKLVEALEALDSLRRLLDRQSESALETKEIREPLEEAAEKISAIYEELTADPENAHVDKKSVN
ncbi:MAG: hypothetical protein JW864_01480 [Spirochaetes bacterium]|nr:hypothetical protein [Spirochaetota bacterium]